LADAGGLAVAIFIKFEAQSTNSAGRVVGDAADPHHAGWFELDSWRFQPAGAPAHEGARQLDAGEGKLAFTKLVGPGDVALFTWFQNGWVMDTAILEMAKGVDKLTITLANVGPASYSLAPSVQGGPALLAMSLAYKRLDISYSRPPPDGAPSPNPPVPNWVIAGGNEAS
jgi:type VI protein secretion system component Hcp